MKQFSHLSITSGIIYLLVVILFVNCKKEYHSADTQVSSQSISMSNEGGLVETAFTQSQTRIAHLFNNFNGFDDPYVNNWAQNEPELVATDDNVYAYSNILAKKKPLSVSLKDFRFDIPSGATISKIIVTVRRFKTGNGSIADRFATLNIVDPRNPGLNVSYGFRWTDPTKYPATETAFNYSQNGAGSSGGNGKPYQWTPLMINNPGFGVRIDIAEPAGSVVVYYDYVQITVEYS